MSTFKCEVVKIDGVENHPNADRLSIIKIRGFDCISAKLDDGSHRYNVGDLVVYIPEQSIVPEWLLKTMGFWDEVNNCGTLSGGPKNRVKAIRLRGIFSQGILFPVRNGFVEKEFQDFVAVKEGDDVAEIIGVTKFEPTIPIAFAGKMGALFGHTIKFDLESYQNNPTVFNENDYVVATEKLHGTCFQMGVLLKADLDETQLLSTIDLTTDYCVYVTSKGLGAKGFVQKPDADNENNVYLKIAKQYFIDNGKLKQIVLENKPEKNLVIFGEIYGTGIQDLVYDGSTDIQFRMFDMLHNDRYLDYDQMMNVANFYDIPTVPLLYRGKFNRDELIKHRDGMTVLGGKNIREGIVIKPIIEQTDIRGLPCGGRKQLKWVSPDYLLRKNGTEYN